MKPDFTLSLSADKIQLLHRNARGWTLIGEAKVADPDLSGAMSSLRTRALGLANGKPFGTKILIPNEQIRYLSLDTTRATEDDVRTALDGATPYPVADLVYDFVTGGGRTYIAAASRRTLTEAEAFAVSHDMAPLCFAAAPVPFTFLGEVFFGPTRASRDILPFGTFLDRDPEPVIVTSRLDGDEDGAVRPRSVPPPILSQMQVTAAAPDQHGATPAKTSDAPQPGTMDGPATAVPGPSADPAPAPAQKAAPDDAGRTVFAGALPGFTTRRDPTNPPKPAESTADPAPTAAADAAPPVAETGFASRRSPTNPPRTPAPPVAAAGTVGAIPPAPPLPAEEAAPSFATRREPTEPPRTAPSISELDPPPDITVVGAALPSSVPDITRVGTPLPAPEPPADPEKTVIGAALPTEDLKVAQPGDVAPVASPPLVTAASLPGGSAPSVRAEPRSLRAEPPAPKGGGFFSRRRAAKGAAKAPQTVAAKSPFGTKPDPRAKPKVGGKPRFLGLILTVLLLVFMAAVAAYAALSEEGLARFFRSTEPEATQVAAAPEAPASGIALDPAPDLGLGPAPDQPVASLPGLPAPILPGAESAPVDGSSSVAPPQSAIADALPGYDPATPAPDRPAAVAPVGRVLSPDEAERAYAATGVWQRAPRLPLEPRVERSLGFQGAALYGPLVRSPLPALTPESDIWREAVFLAPPDPPPPGVTFPRDARGFILATPDGTVLPDGVVVFAGSPALLPPVRPGTEPPPPLVAEDGLVVIAGRPPLSPPIRPAAVVEAAPDPVVPEAPANPEIVEAGPDVVAPDARSPLAEGLVVIEGAPPLSPPTRPGPAAGVAELVTDPDLPVELPQEPPVTTATGEGLVVIEGAPPLAPPPRPGSEEAPAQAAAPAETAPAAAEAPAGGIPAVAETGEDLIVVEGAPPLSPPARPAPSFAFAAAPDGRPVVSATDGLVVLAGAPVLRPPARTSTPVEVPPEITTAPADAPSDPATDVVVLPAGGTGLGAFRPQTRPATLVPASVQAVPADPALAGFRPQARPASLSVPSDEEAEVTPEPAPASEAEAALAAAIQTAVQAAAAAAPRIVDATPQAITVSSRPDARPRNFSRVVEQVRQNQARQAQRQQQLQQQQQQQQQQAQREAEEADDEPELISSVRTAGPTAQSVAAAATIQNAINLRQISLLGVYGSPSNRRALIRMGNGRLVKVGVGDRLDGGQVGAIGDSFVDYTKRGRTLRLEMPRG